MWNYEKRLQFPVHITKSCPKTAQLIISQFGDQMENCLPLCVIFPRDTPCHVKRSAGF